MAVGRSSVAVGVTVATACVGVRLTLVAVDVTVGTLRDFVGVGVRWVSAKAEVPTNIVAMTNDMATIRFAVAGAIFIGGLL